MLRLCLILCCLGSARPEKHPVTEFEPETDITQGLISLKDLKPDMDKTLSRSRSLSKDVVASIKLGHFAQIISHALKPDKAGTDYVVTTEGPLTLRKSTGEDAHLDRLKYAGTYIGDFPPLEKLDQNGNYLVLQRYIGRELKDREEIPAPLLMHYFNVQHLHKYFKRQVAKRTQGKVHKIKTKLKHRHKEPKLVPIVAYIEENPFKITYDENANLYHLKNPLKSFTIVYKEGVTWITNPQIHFDVAYYPDTDELISSKGPLPKTSLLVRAELPDKQSAEYLKKKIEEIVQNSVQKPEEPYHPTQQLSAESQGSVPYEILKRELQGKAKILSKPTTVVNFLNQCVFVVVGHKTFIYIDTPVNLLKPDRNIQDVFVKRDYGADEVHFFVKPSLHRYLLEETDGIDIPQSSLPSVFKDTPVFEEFVNYVDFREFEDLLPPVIYASRWTCEREWDRKGGKILTSVDYQLIFHEQVIQLRYSCKEKHLIIEDLTIIDWRFKEFRCTKMLYHIDYNFFDWTTCPPTQGDFGVFRPTYIRQVTRYTTVYEAYTRRQETSLFLLFQDLLKIYRVSEGRRKTHLRNRISDKPKTSIILIDDEVPVEVSRFPGKIRNKKGYMVVRGFLNQNQRPRRALEELFFKIDGALEVRTHRDAGSISSVRFFSTETDYKRQYEYDESDVYVAARYVTLETLSKYLNKISTETLYRCAQIRKNVKFSVDLIFWRTYKLEGGAFDCAGNYFLFDFLSKYEFLTDRERDYTERDYTDSKIIQNAQSRRFVYVVNRNKFIPEGTIGTEKISLFAVKLASKMDQFSEIKFGAPIKIDEVCSFRLQIEEIVTTYKAETLINPEREIKTTIDLIS